LLKELELSAAATTAAATLFAHFKKASTRPPAPAGWSNIATLSTVI
jgi:hypothetical protein